MALYKCTIFSAYGKQEMKFPKKRILWGKNKVFQKKKELEVLF